MRRIVGPLAMAAVAALVCVPAVAGAQPAPIDSDADYDYEAPDEDYVWEDGDELEGGNVSEGFYRVRERPGYHWVEGAYVRGVWIEGHWAWTGAARPGQIWEAGFRGSDGYYVSGHWRPQHRGGYVWVPAHRSPSGWVDGYWRPLG